MSPWVRIFMTVAAAWLAIVQVIESRDRKIARALGGTMTHEGEDERHALAPLKAAA